MDGWTRRIAGITAGLAASILLLDYTSIIHEGLWLTSGRVTYLVGERFTLTGSLVLDLFLLYFLEAALILLARGVRRRVLLWVSLFALLLVPVFIYTGTFWLVYLLASTVLLLAALVYLLEEGWKRGFIQGVLFYTAGVGLAALLQVVVWAVRGETITHPLPILVIVVSDYRLWMLTPILLLGAGLLSGLALLLPGYWRRLAGRFWADTGGPGDGALGGWGVMDGRRVFLGLGVAVLLGFLVAFVPYLPTVNPRGAPATTDWIYYYRWLRSIDRVGLTSVLRMHMDRPLYILLLYGVERLFHLDPRVVSVYQHLVISPLYVLASYYLASSLLDRRTGVYAALLAPLSPVFLSFQYGGFQADFFTVSIVFFALGILYKAKTRAGVIAGFLLFDLAMLLHEWTWTQYMTILLVYVGVTALREYKNGVSGKTRLMLVLLALSVAADIAKAPLGIRAPSSALGVANASITGFHHGGPIDSIHFLTTIYTGGGLNNPVFNTLVLIGALLTGSAQLLAATIFLSLTPFALLPYVFTYRVLVNTPIQAVAGAVLGRAELLEVVLLFITLASVAFVQIACISYTPLF